MKPGLSSFLFRVWYNIYMAPYKRMPRRHFTDQMFNPYFKSPGYIQEHGKTEESIEKAFLKFFHYMKKVFRNKQTL